MNLFRSEDHARKWSRFSPESEQGIVPLANIVALFSGDLFRKRLEPDYASRVPEYWGKVIEILGERGKTLPFWAPPGS